MKEKNIILAARAISMVFTPFYLPLVGLSALFTFSYMSLLPWQYKASVLLTVAFLPYFYPHFSFALIVAIKAGLLPNLALRSAE